jgi:allene oxide cyclase
VNTKSGILTAAALMAGAGVVVTGTMLGSSDAADPHQNSSFTVIEHATSDMVVDLGDTGDSQGDLLSFQNAVYDAADEHPVGHDLGYCVRTSPGKAFECTWTLVVEGGSIVVQGPFRDAGDSTLAVTGGTGKFTDAGGTMRLHAFDAAGTRFEFAYHLTR